MPVAQPQLVRCSKCRRDYELAHGTAGCPSCGGAIWVAAQIAERDANVSRTEAAASA
jgi:rRNA maturation endonuclease Nob1